ncbi:MAG: NAD(P)-dependent oxidoreductase [Ignavibacteria bacterium]|nr:NAD(P)-dependent oxidoreductase [Ignavibacteria bacterium]
MKIFITGGSGLIGQYLNIALSEKHEILTQYHSHIGNCKHFNSTKVDICDYASLEKIFQTFSPQIVIHTAAISNPEKADAIASDLVFEINVNTTKRIAELCDKYNAKLIYLSTDLVYAGYRGSMLKEDAKLIPISLYAETKLMGEIKIQQTFNNYIILREALVYGIGLNHARNNFHLMYEKLSNGNPVVLFSDQFRTPLALKDSSRMVSELIEKNISGDVINFAGKERVSRLELGEILCDVCNLDKNLLVKSTMDEANPVYKVADVSLNIEKLESLGIKPKSIEESIREMFANV